MNNNMDAINEHRQYISELRKQLAERDARIAELEAAQAWISVDERLPEDADKVIGLYKNGRFWRYMLIHYFSEIGFKNSWDNRIDILYWMPLPPPPVTDVTP